jgi:hypothetical protein
MCPSVSHVLLALAALAACVGVAATFADSPGARSAYALVDPNNGAPRLVAAHTQGFVGVSPGPFGSGDYCLTPAAGVDVTDTAAVASEKAFHSTTAGSVTVRYPTAGPTCGANQLEVKTFDQSVQLPDQIAFTVNVPWEVITKSLHRDHLVLTAAV